MAVPIELPFATASELGPRNRVLAGRADWRQVANTVERLCSAAMSGFATSDGTNGSCCQVSLGSLAMNEDAIRVTKPPETMHAAAET